jgi:superfamily II DNA or RNA helicase
MKVIVDSMAWFPSEALPPMQAAALKAQLTLQPRKFSGVPGPAPGPIRLYVEKGDWIGVPRSYYAERRKPHHIVEDATTDGNKALWDGPMTFVGSLREEQQRAVDTIVSDYESGSYGGMLKAVPGFGKTVCACAISARIGVPTLVVVHKEFLVNQWRERIEQFLPGTKVGLVQQDTVQYRDCGIVLAMIHSLVGDRDYGKEFWDWPGLVIFDEAHRVGAETFSRAPMRFRARYRLGVSATPRRKDGCEDAFFHHLGKVLFTSVEQRLIPKIRRVWTEFKLVHTGSLNPSLVSKQVLLKFLCGNKARNAVIVEQLVKAAAAGRKPIVLSERLQHLDVLEADFKRRWDAVETGPAPSTGFYVGGMKEDELEDAAKARVIFATRQFAEEGLDIPELDTIFLTTPMSDVDQAVGRILRPAAGKKEPIVVDFRDENVSLCKKAGDSRERFYQSKGWA